MTKDNVLSFLLLLFFFSPFPPPIRGKLEKERKEKTRQLGLIRAEGSDGGEDMERERRTFQLQMCEVGDLCQSKYQTQTPFTYLRWAWFRSHGWSALWIPYSIHGQLDSQDQPLLCLSSNSYDRKNMFWSLIGWVLQSLAELGHIH